MPNDYTRARTYGTLDYHGLTFRICKPRKRRRDLISRFVLVYENMPANGSGCAETLSDAITYFREGLTRFPTPDSLRTALANLHVRGGARIL